MAYRNGTYVAFHAGGTTDPTASDIKYYNTMKMCAANKAIDFKFTDSHEKTSAVRDSSSRATLERALRSRLNDSKNFILILTARTKDDTDWVPFEIRHSVDSCNLPIIAAYPDYRAVLQPSALAGYWPPALASRINGGSAKVIHIPFAKDPILAAISKFSVHSEQPKGSLVIYTAHSQRNWGLLKSYEKEQNQRSN